MIEGITVIRAEYYVTRIVKHNDDLRRFLWEEIGSFGEPDAPEEILLNFADQFRLATIAAHLRCSHDDVFAVLRSRIEEWLLGRPTNLSVYLPDEDVGLLFDSDLLTPLAEMLNCADRVPEILETLFDLTKVQRLAQEAGIVSKGSGHTVQQLLFQMIGRDGRAKLASYTGISDIWILLTSVTSGQAKRVLCEHLGCTPGEMFGAIAGISRKPHVALEAPKLSGDQDLDSLAIERLKATLRSIADFYLRHVTRQAATLGTKRVSAFDIHSVEPTLLFFGRRDFAPALSKIYREEETIGGIGGQLVPGALDVLYSDQQEVRATIPADDNAGHLKFEYRDGGDQQWRHLCTKTGVSAQDAEFVRGVIPRAANLLQGTGDTLVQRVLSSRVPRRPSPATTAWRSLVDQDGVLDHRLVRMFVLAKMDFPASPLIDVDFLEEELTNKDEVSKSSVIEAPDTERILETARKRWQERGIEVAVVEL